MKSQLAQRASSGGRASGGACTLCIEGFMESFYLFSYRILTVTQIKKRIFKALFFPPPSSESKMRLKSSSAGLFFFLFCFTQQPKLCIFLTDQTSMMLYYCMHFNFFFQVKRKHDSVRAFNYICK